MFNCLALAPSRSSRFLLHRFLVTVVALSVVLSPARLLAHPGRWSPPEDWEATAVHMALLPGDGAPYHSRVLWWQEEGASGIFGGQWGWKPANVDCSAYPESAFTEITLPDPNPNIFCSGFVPLPDGRLIVVAGTEGGTENGLKSVNIFTPGSGTNTGSWAAVDPMSERRYYPTATLLNDGRILATSGSKYPHINFFGGITNGAASPTDSSIGRYGAAASGIWDTSALPPAPTQFWPAPRVGHSSAWTPYYGNTIYFGGRFRTGQLTSETWFSYGNLNIRGEDYAYSWARPHLVGSSQSINSRAEHSAVTFSDTAVVVFGGNRLSGTEAPTSQVLRLRPAIDVAPPDTGWKWEAVSTSAGPSARFSHTAFYDADRHRMIVFGGVSDTTSGPADTTVWSLQFNAGSGASATWKQLTVVSPGVHPTARYDHSLEFDDLPHTYVFAAGDTVKDATSAVLFGGRATSTRYNDLWRLLLLPDSTVRWYQYSISGTKPATRSGHTGTYERGTQRLYVFGGMTASAATGDTMWVVDLDDASPSWQAFATKGSSLSGQTAVLDYPIFTRKPEIYSSAQNTWTTATGALFQGWYPQTFVAPNGKVFNSGPSDSSYYFDPSAGTWSAFPSTGTSGFIGGSAVMYRPGKVMKCGTRDTERRDAPAVQTTKTIDLTAGSPSWQSSGNMSLARVNMNLTLLPTGEVLVTGGTGQVFNDGNLLPVKQPEIWDPNANSGAGAWYGASGAGQLDSSSVIRGYHSTAILLPDGRILCAGGNKAYPDQEEGNLYCPPYLFNSDGSLATRPTHSSTPARHVKWGKVFTVATSRAATVQSVCLMKPGASTHAFDQNQRYVPLSFSRATSPSRLFVTAPADSNVAPPGDYLLFMVDSVSSTSNRVPSVATWLKVDRSSGRDSADATGPDAINDLAGGCLDDWDGGHFMITWSAPGDDGVLTASGAAKEFDLRRSSSPITTDVAFNAATVVTGLPIPGVYGTNHDVTLQLGAGTYYLRIKTRDDNEQLSAMSNQLTLVVPSGHYFCESGFYGGSGGGEGSSLQRAADGTNMRSTTRAAYSTAFIENTLFTGADTDAKATDILRLASPRVSANGAVQVRLRTERAGQIAIDRVRLMVADHTPETSAYSVSASVTLGSRAPAVNVLTNAGTDITNALEGGYSVPAGEVLSVDLGSGAEASTAPLVLEAASGTAAGPADSSGILILSPDGAGGWQTVHHVYPRLGMDEIPLDGVRGRTFRLQFLSGQSLQFVGRLAVASETPTVQWATLLSAVARGLTDKTSLVASADTLAQTLAGPDTLSLSFAAPDLAEGRVRDYFLVIDATPLSTRNAGNTRSALAPPTLPTAFALRQNQPNPFSRVTGIRFELPVGAMVRMDVFDAQGRRVRRLVSHFFPAGYHSVAWDHASDDGRHLGPGVYFYRIEAGAFRDRKKMVLLAD